MRSTVRASGRTWQVPAETWNSARHQQRNFGRVRTGGSQKPPGSPSPPRRPSNLQAISGSMICLSPPTPSGYPVPRFGVRGLSLSAAIPQHGRKELKLLAGTRIATKQPLALMAASRLREGRHLPAQSRFLSTTGNTSKRTPPPFKKIY